MAEDSDRARKDIEQLLNALRQEIIHGSVKLFREYLAPDATIFAFDDPRIFKGKDACLEYIRIVEQQTKLHRLDATIEDLKILGDMAIVLDRAEGRYEMGRQTYRDTARTTWILVRDGGHWRVQHLHMESLAPNRIVGADGGG